MRHVADGNVVRAGDVAHGDLLVSTVGLCQKSGAEVLQQLMSSQRAKGSSGSPSTLR